MRDARPNPLIPMAAVEREYAALRDDVLHAVARVLETGRFILGREVTALESEMVAHVGGAHVVGCANGTDALVLALRALDIGPGDEVIVPAFTFVATAEAVAIVGATPVFADIEAHTFAIDPGSVADRVNPRTRAILPVHLFGLCTRMEPLREIATKSRIHIIEDAAQAIGARWRGTPAGALGDVAAFSFFPTKNLGAPGDGGMVTTTDATLADKLRRLRGHGRGDDGRFERIGLNSRLDEIHAAVLRVKLRYLDGWNEKRRATAARYGGALSGGDIAAPVELDGARHVYHHFTVRTPHRADLAARLAAAGVASAVYYSRALHEQPAYARWAHGPLPEAERAAREVLSVPVHPWLTDDEIGRVAEALAATR
jgi:dTDP-4-amino-4,6-dideoxygalactose transaminase